jgi:hypothetical protein
VKKKEKKTHLNGFLINIFRWSILILILAAILKIFKRKSTTLSDDLFLCQVSKGSAVWGEINIFCTLVIVNLNAIIDHLKNFNVNGYLQGVRHAAPYCDHFGLLWRPF